MKVLEVLVVRVDHDRVRRAFQVDPPLAESSDNCKQLLVVDRVVKLRSTKFPRVVSDGVELTCRVSLREDAAQAKVGGIRFNGDR